MGREDLDTLAELCEDPLLTAEDAAETLAQPPHYALGSQKVWGANRGGVGSL